MPNFLPSPFITYTYPICFLHSYLHLGVCFPKDPADTVGCRSGAGKQEVRCVLGMGSNETWGTDALAQNGSPIAKTSGVAWLLLSCIDDL